MALPQQVVAAHRLRAQPLTLTAVSDIVAAMTAPAVLRGYLLEEGPGLASAQRRVPVVSP
jgi:hypothetical protein